VMAYHHERLRERADKDGLPFDHELAVTSVYEFSEGLEKLMPFPWAPSE